MPPASIMRASRCCTAAISSTSARRQRLYCDCDGSCGNQPGRTLATKPRNCRSEQMPIAEDIACNHEGFQVGRHLEPPSRGTRLEALLRAPPAGPCSEPPFHIKPLVLELVRLRAEHLEPRLEEVVRSGRTERPGQQPAEARREHLARRERRCAPGSDAAWAGHELAERTPEALAGGPLVLARLRLALDERLPDEARDTLAGERPRRLERRGRERDEVERSTRRRPPRDGRNGRDPAQEDACDRGVALVRRAAGRR